MSYYLATYVCARGGEICCQMHRTIFMSGQSSKISRKPKIKSFPYNHCWTDWRQIAQKQLFTAEIYPKKIVAKSILRKNQLREESQKVTYLCSVQNIQ